MRALVLTAPRQTSVQDVPDPVPAAGELLVDVERVGICGTDVELYTGQMTYFEQGHTHFPVRLGHEWTGRVSAVGHPRDNAWIGTRVTGDTMLDCSHCDYFLGVHHHRSWGRGLEPDRVAADQSGRADRYLEAIDGSQSIADKLAARQFVPGQGKSLRDATLKADKTYEECGRKGLDGLDCRIIGRAPGMRRHRADDGQHSD